MFNLFSRKTKTQKLEEKYRALLDESYQLSTSNRRLSDAKRAEAEEVMNEIEFIKSSN